MNTISVSENNSISLVLCGGGAKGSYQIGVWRYLSEQGMRIDGLSGASIGAVNSLLIAQGDLELATEVWQNVRQADLTHPRLAVDERTEFEALDFAIPAIELYLQKYTGLLPAFFSQRGLRRLLQDNIQDWNRVISRENLFVCLARIPQEMAKSENIASVYQRKNWDPEYIHLHNCNAADIMEVVLASCAIPLFFKAKRIGGNMYVDGGWADNMPIRPLLKKGYKSIAIVHLRNETEYELSRRERSLQGFDLSDTEIIDIYPSIPLYEYDTLCVDQSRILELMECGYKDAKMAFEKTGAGHMQKSSYKSFN